MRCSPVHLAAVALLVFAACSSNNGSKYPDVNSFCNGRASAECGSAVVKNCAIPDMSMCVAKRQLICVNAVPAGTTYNASAAETCVTTVQNAYADADITPDESTAIATACLPVFDGPNGQGAPCQQDTDCKVSTGLRCVPAPGSTQGTCQVPQDVQGGGNCSTPSARCIAGYHCGVTAHCDINAALNETCDSQTPCAPDLQCSSTTKTCVNKSPDGSMCSAPDECLHGLCSQTSAPAMMTDAMAIIPVAGLCVPALILAPNEPFCVESR